MLLLTTTKMSTQDESLMAAFNGPEDQKDAPQQDPQTVDTDKPDSNDVPETPPEKAEPEEVKKDSPKVDEPEDKTEPTKEESLTPQVQTMVDNFSRLSEKKKALKLEELKNSNRSDQIEAAEAIENIFGIPEVEAEPMQSAEPQAIEIDPEMLNEAVQSQLKEMGVTEAFETVTRSAEEAKRALEIEAWSKEKNLNLNSEDIKSDVNFLKAFHSPDNKDLPLRQRTRLALFETQNNSEIIQATPDPVGAPPVNDAVAAAEENTLKDWFSSEKAA